jgi:hypothetical protein
MDTGILAAMFVLEVLLAGIARRRRDPQMLTAGKGKQGWKTARRSTKPEIEAFIKPDRSGP